MKAESTGKLLQRGFILRIVRRILVTCLILGLAYSLIAGIYATKARAMGRTCYKYGSRLFQRDG